jgi:hypothetical protein
MCLDEITGKDLAGTDTTVVRTLRTGETSLGPAIWVSIGIEDGVLLLETEPGLSVGSSVHDLLAVSAVVGLVDSAIVVVTLAEDEDVGTSTERVLEDGNGALGMSAGLEDNGHTTGRWPVKLMPRGLPDVAGGCELTRNTSELSPGAWLVDDPSKFHSLRSETLAGAFSRVMVLLRRPPSPSIQMSVGGRV